MINSQNEFIPPPEAPVFEPTREEFEDPMLYISKIRPIAEKAGICKIRPPSCWQPPFAVDVDNFHFTPRVQRLNELEAKTRIKLNFLDQLAKFWELQGVPLKIPLVDKKCLDIFSLYKAVHDDGGFSFVSKNNKWTKIAVRLGYSDNFGSILQQHYDKILFPYDIFIAKVDSAQDTQIKDTRQKRCKSEAGKQEEESGHGSSKSEINVKTEDDTQTKHLNYSLNSELKKLQFYGAGPKTAIPDATVVCEKNTTQYQGSKITRMKTRDKRILASLEGSLCCTCSSGGNYENMLICDSCDDVCHIDCLILPLTDNQKGEWRCPECIAKECRKPAEAYGFEQARREYTLQTFGQMADKFKIDYFNNATHMVACSVVEREFWRLVNCIEEDVVVEYGADIHSSECGSGFPTEKTRQLFPDEDKYIISGWNLNNIPVLPTSVLRYINVDISGMKVPWCYVGMCFSSFAWHIEDHWSYSINYLHWGEPKTWYGVPGAKAELLEECMKSNASELFEQSPDLLHQLTTIMNPNTLMQCGVPIVRTDQVAGEFVITFPRSYHAGFNQGYNFAEAVNFCSAEWLPMGRLCIEHYRLLKRQCVFSHEELICKMSADTESLNHTMAVMVHQNLLAMIEEEKMLRKQLLDKGVMDAEKEAFELLPDDERQCDYCKTTCFLSAVTCSCSESKLVCIHHYDKLCVCSSSQLCLRYRYTLDELLALLHRLRVLLEDFDNWACKAKTIMSYQNEKRQDISVFRALLKEAEDKHFPICPLRDSLVDTCTEAEKCVAVVSHLVSKKTCTRQRETGENRYAMKLSLREFEDFLEEIQTLSCKIKEEAIVMDLMKKLESFQELAKSCAKSDSPDLERLEKLLDEGVMLDVELPELTLLKETISRIKWLEEVNDTLTGDQMTWETICHLIDTGVSQNAHSSVEVAIAQLQDILASCEAFDKKAKDCLQAKPKPILATVELIIDESKKCPVKLSSIAELSDGIRMHKEWLLKFQALDVPHLAVAENLLAKGQQIPFVFDQFCQLESQVSIAKAWRDQTTKVFLKKKSPFSLLEVLSQRTDINNSLLSNNKRKHKGGTNYERSNPDPTTQDTKESVVTSEIEENKPSERLQETTAFLDLRSANQRKLYSEDQDTTHCMCHLKKHGTMIQCQLCNELYHVKCLTSARHLLSKDVSSSACSFLCPFCARSQRPTLLSLGSLLIAMKTLPLKLPEGDALKSLVERTISWQGRVQDVLSDEDLSHVLEAENTSSINSSSLIKEDQTNLHFHQEDADCNDPRVNLSDLLSKLELLMIEGDLLEVSLEEKDTLRSILKRFHVNYKGTVLIFPEISAEGEDLDTKRQEKRVAREMRKRPLELEMVTGSGLQAVKPKRIRKLKEKSRSGETEMDLSFISIEETEEDEDEDCSADKCLKPTSDEVEWIQCDKCQKWFHFLCIGIKKGDISENEEYECETCSNRNLSSSSSNCGFVPIIQEVVSIANQEINSDFNLKHSFSLGVVLQRPVKDSNPDEVVDISDSESEELSFAVGNEPTNCKQPLDCDVIILE